MDAILGEEKAKVKVTKKQRGTLSTNAWNGGRRDSGKIFHLSKELLRDLPKTGTP
jgi:hypothetical protein